MALIKIDNIEIEIFRKKGGAFSYDIFINKRRTILNRKTYPTYEDAYFDALSEYLTLID